MPDLDSLFERHFDAVYGYLALRVAPDEDLARDLAQEVFRVALSSAGPRRASAERAWLIAIARHRVVDHFRRRRPSSLDDAGAALAALARVRNADERERRERATLVSVVLRSLEPGLAELLEEKYLDACSTRELAERHGRTEKAIESALTRAREAFRRAWSRLRAEQECPR